MERKIKIKHQTGSKAGQVEEFPATSGDLKIGRGNQCRIQYDPDLDDTVSREHASISTDGKEADTFWIEDYNSSNGLFVNGKQVWGKVKIYAGDTVQAGADGPTFIFDLDPRPESHIRKTQVLNIPPLKATTSRKAVTPAPEQADGSGDSAAAGTPPPAAPVKQGVGMETVQRMVVAERKKSKAGMLLIVAGILALVVAGGVALHRKIAAGSGDTGTAIGEMRGRIDEGLINLKDSLDAKTRPNSKTPSQIAAENSDKVIFIEMAWKLIYTPTSEDIVHHFITTEVYGIKKRVGAFIQTQSGIEPLLFTRSEAPNADFEPIHGAGSSSGFVIAPDGFILTNRHVAANWLTAYLFPENTFPGVMVDDLGNVIPNTCVTAEMVKGWVPAGAMNINNRYAAKLVEGTNTYLDITFARNDLRIPAKVTRISNRHDVAMIKIDIPKVLPTVDMLDNYTEIKTGDVVTVMGYPGASPDQYSHIQSHDYFNSNPQLVRVPVPTLSQGNIGRLIRGSGQTSSGNYYSSFGDSYQLTINSTGPGNSGGPLFDDLGRVIGIFNAGNGIMTFAVPIKYGLELMGTEPVIESR
ncbi:MAG: trypsin-like peptidase domain-containing protein [Tannerella sp.]|jgi:S1-C subfamily serine protease|nr:trypsin-like peptidase domain-containing protein [Tannerella sp.]